MKTQSKMVQAAKRILVVLLLLAFSSVAVRAFDSIYAFGDSLSDTGNIPAPAPDYFDGRFSNGKLWIEYLSPQLGFEYKRTNNYAQEGAPTSMVLLQASKFSPSGN